METEEAISSSDENRTEKVSNRVLFVKFDKFGRLCVETENTGFRVYKISFKEKLLEFENSDEMKNVSIFECFNRKISAYVTSDKERSLYIYDISKNKQLERHVFNSKVVSVKTSKLVYFTFFTDHGYVCDSKTFERLQKIDSVSTEAFVCCISPSLESAYLAYATTNKGMLVLYNVKKLEETKKLQAHQNSLRMIGFNSEGSLLATCSELGTLIRLFSVPGCKKLKDFRRGTMSSASIDCLTFCDKSEFLAVTGSTKTVHLFLIKSKCKLDNSLSALATNTAGYVLLTFVTGPLSKFSFVQKTVETVGKYVLSSVSDAVSNNLTVKNATSRVNDVIKPFVPKYVSDVLNEERAAITFKCTEKSVKRVCRFARCDKNICLVLVGENGNVSYLDLEEDKIMFSQTEIKS